MWTHAWCGMVQDPGDNGESEVASSAARESHDDFFQSCTRLHNTKSTSHLRTKLSTRTPSLPDRCKAPKDLPITYRGFVFPSPRGPYCSAGALDATQRAEADEGAGRADERAHAL